MSNSPQFTVGCQAEVVCRYKPNFPSDFEDVDAFAENLALRYRQAAGQNDPEIYSSSQSLAVANHAAKWMIIEDLSIDYDEDRGECIITFPLQNDKTNVS